MKRLTKKQKLQAYSFAYLSIYSGTHPSGDYFTLCVCDSLLEFLNNHFCSWDWQGSVLSYFPEFAKQRPEDPNIFWWPKTTDGNLSRLRAIERAIQLVEKSK